MQLSRRTTFGIMAILCQYLESAQFPRLGAQKCTDIFEGRGCTSLGARLCCEEDLVNIISCDKKTKKIKYFHCTGGRICDPDGKGDIGCFIPGTQPTPPPGLSKRANLGAANEVEEGMAEGWSDEQGKAVA